MKYRLCVYGDLIAACATGGARRRNRQSQSEQSLYGAENSVGRSGFAGTMARDGQHPHAASGESRASGHT